MTKNLVALLITAGLAVAAVACDSNGDEEPTPTGTTAPTATAVTGQLPEEIDGVAVQRLAVEEEVELPEGARFVAVVGCIECHCPCVTGLVQVSRGPAGEARMEILFPPAAGLPPRLVVDDKSPEGARQEEPYVNGGFVTTGGGSEIAVAVCSRGGCGPVDEGTPDAETTVYRSSDGGETWEALGILDGVFYAEAMVEGGVVISGPHGPRQAEFRRQVFPAGDTIEQPAGAAPGSPISLPDGELVWRTEDGAYVRSDGSVFLALDVEPLGSILPGPEGDGFVIQWGEPVENVQGFNVVAFFGIVGEDGHLSEVFSVPAGRLEFGGWLDSTRAIANAWVIPPDAEFSLDFWRPVIIDLVAGAIHPIAMPNSAEGFTQPAILRQFVAVQ